MSDLLSRLHSFSQSYSIQYSGKDTLQPALDRLVQHESFKVILSELIEQPVFSKDFGQQFVSLGAVEGIAPSRLLRGALNLALGHFLTLFAQLIESLNGESQRTDSARNAEGERALDIGQWRVLADCVLEDDGIKDIKLITYLTSTINDAATVSYYSGLRERLVSDNPHAIYPTSGYRESDGSVVSTSDNLTSEAVMSFSTFATIRTVDDSLNCGNNVLRDIYKPLGRCVCLIDENVETIYGQEISTYFEHHNINLEKLVYRAMEIDKGIDTVESMLGDFKRCGVSRNEPILIIGGGVLSDTGGLASALYGRNTPYVMLSTSIVTGIDAGPSPRTCCDGFGYKNLLGAYHPPVVSITDRFFFKSLSEGWLRHGIAEIIKMAVVKNLTLFEQLESANAALIFTRFGTRDCDNNDDIQAQSQAILGGALKSYIEAEYDNLYETHQCRPHAYGHTWSPGFEIEAGLLHGHAVAIGMGLGAYLSHQAGWITREELFRILKLMSDFGLSLWHDILENQNTMEASHAKIIEKRGGNLVAPLPRGGIGSCGYLNDLSAADLCAAIPLYKSMCATFPRDGRGIDPLCSDVGLESPSTVAAAL
jgi:3-dehydroquinate synthetase